MSHYACHSFLAFVVSSLVCPLARGQAETTVNITIDATQDGAPLEPVWAFFGYDEANYTTLPEGRDLLRTLAAAHDVSGRPVPVRVRTHFLFNTGDGAPALKWGSTNVYTEDESGAPVYDYTILDQIMDATLEAGTFPLFELGFMPQALSIRPEPYQNSSPYVLDGGAFFPPTDYQKWAGLVRAWALHARDRHDASQTNWLWELWNEPDIGYFEGTVQDFARLYDHTEAALHEALPDALLGGPAIARPNETFLAEFLEHCATGVNAVTGVAGTRLDFVSFHAKGGVTLSDGHVQMDLGNQLRLHRAGFETVAASPTFQDAPIIITEADPDGCAACPSSVARHLDYRNSPAYGAYVIAMMKRSIDLAAAMDVDLDGVLTWAFTYPGTPYFAGYRALSTNGLDLPVLNAIKLLARMGPQRIPAQSSGALTLDQVLEDGVRGQADVDVLASRSGEQVQVLVWNYHDDLTDSDVAQVGLQVKVPDAFSRGAKVAHWRVDDAHGNAFTVWQAQGQPESPSKEQLDALHEAADALQFTKEQQLEVHDGAVSLEFELPRFGTSLITLTPATEGDVSADKGTGCSCRMTPKSPAPPSLLALLFFAALARRGGRGSRSSWAAPPAPGQS